MPITINGTGSITGISAGGLPDDSIVTADIAAGAVTTAKVADANITAAKLSGAQSGSAPIYGARAWVNFAGDGTVAIRSSGNVSSVTDNGVGNYTINFTTAMADTFYAVVCSGSRSSSFLGYGVLKGRPSSTTACPVYFYVEDSYYGEAAIDGDILCVSVFR